MRLLLVVALALSLPSGAFAQLDWYGNDVSLDPIKGQRMRPVEYYRRYLGGLARVGLLDRSPPTTKDLVPVEHLLDRDQIVELLTILRRDGYLSLVADELTLSFQYQGILTSFRRIVGISRGRYLHADLGTWNRIPAPAPLAIR